MSLKLHVEEQWRTDEGSHNGKCAKLPQEKETHFRGKKK